MTDAAELVRVELIGTTADDEAKSDSLVRQDHPASVTFVDSDGSMLGSFYVQFKKPVEEAHLGSRETPWW